MKWLVLGGGQLAKAFEFELRKFEIEHISLKHSDLDIASEVEVFQQILKHKPDVIVNAAAWTNVDLAESMFEAAKKVNAYGPETLAHAAKIVNCKLVQISTDYVFSGKSSIPWKVDDVLSPISSYGLSKAEGEKRVLKTYPEGSYIVRTAWLYSQWGKNFVKTILNLAIQNQNDIEVVADQYGQPTLATDLALQILQMIHRDLQPGIYHGTNAGEISRYEFSQNIFELSGQDKLRVKPIETVKNSSNAPRPLYSVLDHSNWLENGLAPMRHWKLALEESVPIILRSLN